MSDVDQAKFEPISLAVLNIKEEIPPHTPGFADREIEELQKEEERLSFLPEEIEELKKTSWQEGYNQGISEIDREQQKFNKLEEELLNNIANKFSELTPQIEVIKNENATLLVNIAIAVARKVSKDLITQNAEAFIIQKIQKSLSVISKEPSVKISVNSKFLEIITQKMEDLKIKSGFKGEVIMKVDDNLHEINCHIEWQDGMIENDHELIWEEIKKVGQL